MDDMSTSIDLSTSTDTTEVGDDADGEAILESLEGMIRIANKKSIDGTYSSSPSSALARLATGETGMSTLLYVGEEVSASLLASVDLEDVRANRNASPRRTRWWCWGDRSRASRRRATSRSAGSGSAPGPGRCRPRRRPGACLGRGITHKVRRSEP